MTTNASTCTGPYAILIMLGIKRVENRSMCPSPVKGRCAVSCSKSFCKEEFGNFVQWASRALPTDQFASIPVWSDVADWPGKIVGCVDCSCREGCDAESWNERFFVLPLDAECHALSEPILVALGESTTTAVDPAMVFGAALKCEAKSVIVAHNHPSGSPTPSLQDRQLTEALKRLGMEIGVEVRDHLVVGTDGVYSLVAAHMLRGL